MKRNIGVHLKKIEKIFENNSLMKKLIMTYIIIIGIPIVIFTVYIFRSLSVNAIQDAKDRANYELKTEYDTIEKNVYIMRNIVNAISTNNEIMEFMERDKEKDVKRLINFRETTYKQLINLQNNNPAIKEINIFTSNENASEIWPTFYREKRILHNDWFEKTIRKDGAEYWNINHYDNDIETNSTYNDESKNLVVSLNKKIVYPVNKYVGISRVTMRSEDFFPSMFEENNMKSGQILLIDRENLDINTDENNIILTKYNFDIKEFKEYIRGKLTNEKGEMTFKQGSQDFIVLYKESPITNNYLISIVPINNISNGIESSRRIVILGSIFLLVLLSIIVYMATKTILKGLYKIINAVKQVRTGDLMPNIQVYGSDEVGVLAHNFRQMMKTIDGLIKESINKEVMTKEAELKALKTQIDSHFLYNTLENIRMMAVVEENFMVSDCLASLGDMMRYNMKWNNEFVPLSEEISHIKNYIALMTLRYDNQIVLKLDIKAEFMDIEILKLTIQPLVENAVKHGLAEKLRDEDGVVSLSVETDLDCLYLNVIDDGKGMDAEKVQELQSHIDGNIDKRFGLGLKNVNDRIKLFYGKEYGVIVEAQKDNYTKIKLKLPKEDKVTLSNSSK